MDPQQRLLLEITYEGLENGMLLNQKHHSLTDCKKPELLCRNSWEAKHRVLSDPSVQTTPTFFFVTRSAYQCTSVQTPGSLGPWLPTGFLTSTT